jgi:hypothetical protein
MAMKYLIVHVKVGSIGFMYITTVNNGYAVITGGKGERAKICEPKLMR